MIPNGYVRYSNEQIPHRPQQSLLSEAMRQAAECYITKDSTSRRKNDGEISPRYETSSNVPTNTSNSFDSKVKERSKDKEGVAVGGSADQHLVELSDVENKKLWEQHYSEFLDHLVSMPLPSTNPNASNLVSVPNAQEKSSTSSTSQERSTTSASSNEPNLIPSSLGSSSSIIYDSAAPNSTIFMTTDNIPISTSNDRKRFLRTTSSDSLLDTCPTIYSIRQQQPSSPSIGRSQIQATIVPENEQVVEPKQISKMGRNDNVRNSFETRTYGGQSSAIRSSKASTEEIVGLESSSSERFQSNDHVVTRIQPQHKSAIRLVHSESMIHASDISVASSARSIRSDPKTKSEEKQQHQSLFNKIFKSFGVRRKKQNSTQRHDALDTVMWRGNEKRSTNRFNTNHNLPSNLSECSLHSTQSLEKMMKVAFTGFHNSQHSGVDSANPYLGDNSSLHKGRLFTMYGPIETTKTGHMRLSCSEPIGSDVIKNKEMTLLIPIEGPENWSAGNRYLITPALFTQCPSSVLDFFWSKKVSQSPSDSPPVDIYDRKVRVNYEREPSYFSRSSLGVAAGIHISQGMPVDSQGWLSRVFVLCQNFLLEYHHSDDINGNPRGYIHLQHALVSAHPMFVNAIEIEFTESTNLYYKRKVSFVSLFNSYLNLLIFVSSLKLLIRLHSEETRNFWMELLSNASQLCITDLYEIHHEMAHGRYASIYEGIRKEIEMNKRSSKSKQRPCALKVIDKNEFWGRVESGRERVDTLVREVAVQATLTSGNYKSFFVQIYGVFETAENFVIELELLDGMDLFRYVSDRTVLEEREAALIMRDILISLSTTRHLGIAHRDVKLANILMCVDGINDVRDVTVKLADYGMGTFVGFDGLVRGRCGTPGYVAPEIF